MLRAFEDDLATARASAGSGCPQAAFTVRQHLTTVPNPRRERCETAAYAAFVQRIIEAYGRRVARGDLEDLTEMFKVRKAFDDATTVAIRGGNAGGWSWAQIGAVAKMRRQSAHQRWGGGA